MDTKERVAVKNMVDCAVGLTVPELHYKRTWPKRGAVIMVDKDVLRESIWQTGVANMFNQGILYIEDMEFKKELGLEPDDAQEPVNLIPLDEKRMKRMLTLMPFNEFKESFDALAYNQKTELAQYAVSQKTCDFDRSNVILKATGIDVYKAISLAHQNEEEVANGDTLR